MYEERLSNKSKFPGKRGMLQSFWHLYLQEPALAYRALANALHPSITEYPLPHQSLGLTHLFQVPSIPSSARISSHHYSIHLWRAFLVDVLW